MAIEQVEKPETTSMSLEREFAKRLKTIADFHEVTMFEALERFGGSAIAREYRKVVEAMHAKVTGGEG